MSVTSQRLYVFGSFRLDAHRRVLQSEAGDGIELSSRAFGVLLYLVEHPGQVLDKSAILEAVWPNVIVEENNLNQAVFALRRALGDNPDKPRYIATVPGRGFQFVERVFAPAPDIEPEANAPPPQLAPLTGRVRRRRSPWLLPVAVVIVAAFATAGSLPLLRPPAPTLHTLAVLPFKPLVPVERDRALANGLLYALIPQLSQTPGLRVSPLPSVSRYQGVDQDPLAAGRELGVQSVLEGQASRPDDRLRVFARVIDVATGETRWEQEFDEPFARLYDVQDAIAERVAASLPADIVGRPDTGALRRPTNNPEAYQSWAAGYALFVTRAPPSLERALEFFDQATKLDPQYAVAWSALADCHAVRAVFGLVAPGDAFENARAAAERAIMIDPDSAEAHATMGHIHVQYDRDWVKGEREYQKAMELNPRYAMTYMWLAMLRNYQGKFDEALEYMSRAQELEPDQLAFSTNIGNVLYHARRYDKAIQQLNHTLAANENFDLALAFLGRTYLHSGDTARAIEAFERRRSGLHGRNADLVQAYAKAGRIDEARTLLVQMYETKRTAYVSPYDLAAAHVSLGEHDKALDLLEEALQTSAQPVAHMPTDPAFDPLRDNPRFQRLVQRLAL